METIKTLKSKRAFSAVVRDGIRLIVDLREKNLDVLYELFPWVIDRLAQEQVVIQSPPAPQNNKALEDKIARLEDLILEITRGTLMIQAQSTGQQPDSNRTGQLTGKPLAAPQFALPNWDEEDDTPTVIINKSNDMSSAANFVTALRSMQ